MVSAIPQGRGIDVSIVIPAFNEAKRLPLFLERVIAYCQASERTCEVIVVDDGSRDRTFDVAMSFAQRFAGLSVIRVRRNRGKGYAVKRGLFKARGRVCLFMDADGSTGPEEIDKNIHELLAGGYDIFVGSRVLSAADQVLRVKWYRKLIGKAFNFLVQALLFQRIKDTQCGFKMFKKEVVKPLFSRSYLRGFGFDIEILYLAHKMGYKVKEGPVSWHHVGGSKVNLAVDSLKMFLNILQIRNWHYTPINPKSKYMGPDEYRYMYEMEESHWWFVSHRRLAVRLVRSLGIPSPKILDAGSGTGWNLTTFNEIGQAVGIDVSRQAIAFCLKRGLRNVKECPVEAIDYPDQAFDVVTCLDVLEHVPNPEEALREVRRVLKDRGKLVVTVPAFQTLWSQHDDALCHLRRYEKPSLRSDLEEAGFTVDRMGYFFFASFFAVAPIRLFRRLRLFVSKAPKPHSDTTTRPPGFLNKVLRWLFTVELRLTDRDRLPFGTTLYAVASKALEHRDGSGGHFMNHG